MRRRRRRPTQRRLYQNNSRVFGLQVLAKFLIRFTFAFAHPKALVTNDFNLRIMDGASRANVQYCITIRLIFVLRAAF